MPEYDNMAAADDPGGREHTGSPAADQPQERPSRRSVLRGAAGAGAAGIAATALAGVGGTAFAATTRPARDVHAKASTEDAAEPIVVHLRDAKSGEIDVFRGTSHIRLRDHALAAQLIRASK